MIKTTGVPKMGVQDAIAQVMVIHEMKTLTHTLKCTFLDLTERLV